MPRPQSVHYTAFKGLVKRITPIINGAVANVSNVYSGIDSENESFNRAVEAVQRGDFSVFRDNNSANASQSAKSTMSQVNNAAEESRDNADVSGRSESIPGADVNFSLVGKMEDGRKIYKTNYPKNTPKIVKQNDLIKMVQNIWSKKPIKLQVNDNGSPKNIEVNFDPELSDRSDLSKIVFGNRKGSASEKRMTLDLAGDLYEIAEDSINSGGKDETGKNNPAHNDVKHWEYFVTNLVYEDEAGNRTDCYMNIDVKQKSDGNYFYSFALEKGTAPQTLLAVVSDNKSPAAPTDNRISQNNPVVNSNFMQNAENYASDANAERAEQSPAPTTATADNAVTGMNSQNMHVSESAETPQAEAYRGSVDEVAGAVARTLTGNAQVRNQMRTMFKAADDAGMVRAFAGELIKQYNNDGSMKFGRLFDDGGKAVTNILRSGGNVNENETQRPVQRDVQGRADTVPADSNGQNSESTGEPRRGVQSGREETQGSNGERRGNAASAVGRKEFTRSIRDDKKYKRVRIKSSVGDITIDAIPSSELADRADAQAIIAENKEFGIKTVFFSGNAVVGDTEANGFAIGNTTYISYDSDIPPQNLNAHEVVHTKSGTSAYVKLYNAVYSGLSEDERMTLWVSYTTQYQNEVNKYINDLVEKNPDLSGDQIYMAHFDYIMQEMLGDLNGNMHEMSQYTDRFADALDEFRKAISVNKEIAQKSNSAPRTARVAAEYAEASDAGGEVRASFAGRKANNADVSLLQKAQDMAENGESRENILKETGWLRGADGKWRFEINDKDMQFSRTGFFTNPDVQRYQELEKKYINVDITKEEIAELRQLQNAIKGVRKTPETLADYIKHDKLFEAYPFLRNVKVEFADLVGANGAYDGDTIRLDDSLKKDEQKLKKTLIHEIQHIIQDSEGFARGSSTRYWERIQDANREDALTKAEADERNALRTLMNKASDDYIDKFNEWKYADVTSENAFEHSRMGIELANDKLYGKYFKDYAKKHNYAQRLRGGENVGGKTSKELYYNTAGEIEARDAADRIDMTDEERRGSFPESAKENPNRVFADDSSVSYDYGVTQDDIDDYVENAWNDKGNTLSYKKYAKASNRLISDIKGDFDASGFSHAMRDNDIRHIRNSHGKTTKEKYPVTIDDIKSIPYIVKNYDKVYYNNHNGKDSLIYVKVSPDNTLFFVEQATKQYGNEKLLINKQMIKTGIDDIPSIYQEAINKKEGTAKFLADLEKIRKEYAQSVVDLPSDNTLSQNKPVVKTKSENSEKNDETLESPEVRFSKGEVDNTTKKEYNNTDRYKEYISPEAIKKYSNEKRFENWSHRDIAFISAASWDGIKIPYEVLVELPQIKKAQEIADSKGTAKPISDEEEAKLAARLLDKEHGSAVFETTKDGKSKLRKINGEADYSGDVKREKKAIFVIGRPAGGKSRVFADPLSNKYKARIIDSDTVKPWLEGFDDGYGAGYVQENSAKVMERALTDASNLGENIIIPKIGGNGIIDMAKKLKEMGYSVDLYFNEISQATSIMRAAARFAEEGRFLSIDYLRSLGDDTDNKPYKTFVKYANSGIFDYAEWRNNDVEFGKEARLIWKTGDGEIVTGRSGDVGRSGQTLRHGGGTGENNKASRIDGRRAESSIRRGTVSGDEGEVRFSKDAEKAQYSLDAFTTQDLLIQLAEEIGYHDGLIEAAKKNKDEFREVIGRNKQLSRSLENAKRQMVRSKVPRVSSVKAERTVRGVMKALGATANMSETVKRAIEIYDAY